MVEIVCGSVDGWVCNKFIDVVEMFVVVISVFKELFWWCVLVWLCDLG